MGRGKMDEAAVERIRKARGEKVRDFPFIISMRLGGRLLLLYSHIETCRTTLPGGLQWLLGRIKEAVAAAAAAAAAAATAARKAVEATEAVAESREEDPSSKQRSLPVALLAGCLPRRRMVLHPQPPTRAKIYIGGHILYLYSSV